MSLYFTHKFSAPAGEISIIVTDYDHIHVECRPCTIRGVDYSASVHLYRNPENGRFEPCWRNDRNERVFEDGWRSRRECFYISRRDFKDPSEAGKKSAFELLTRLANENLPPREVFVAEEHKDAERAIERYDEKIAELENEIKALELKRLDETKRLSLS